VLIDGIILFVFSLSFFLNKHKLNYYLFLVLFFSFLLRKNKKKMFDQGTQLLTQIETQSTIEMIDEDEDVLVWGRLIPTRPSFGRIYG
jgi:hypothetical protein